MRFVWCLVSVLVCGSSYGQESASSPRRDPTAPSSEILKRLTATDSAVNAPLSEPLAADEIMEVAPALPEFVLKGLVLSDPNHGTALLETAGRRVAVRLARQPLDADALPAPHTARLSGFSIHGVEYYVLDFSDGAVLLQAPDRTVLVQ